MTDPQSPEQPVRLPVRRETVNRDTRWLSRFVFLVALIAAVFCLGPKGLGNITDVLVYVVVIPLSCTALVIAYRTVSNRGDAVLVDSVGLTIRHGPRRTHIPWSDFEQVTVVPGPLSGTVPRPGSRQMFIGRPQTGRTSRTRAGYFSRSPSPVGGTVEIFSLDALDAPREEVLAALARCAGERWQPPG